MIHIRQSATAFAIVVGPLLFRSRYSGLIFSSRTMSDLKTRQKEAIWGMLIADAMAMPVHWYYKPNLIERDYNGWINGFKAPTNKHPTCIMTLSATDGSGRSAAGKGGTNKPVIGRVILHDKLKYWQGENTHYHQGMKAGENTLNSVVSLKVTLKTMMELDADVTMEPKALRARFMENYVKFMTTPGTHNDTYAESFHRAFFKEWSDLEKPPTKGEDLVKFAEKRFNAVTNATEDGQLPVIGGFSMAAAWAVHYAGKSEDECAQNTIDAVKLTHPAPSLVPYVDLYARLLHRVLNGADLRTESMKIAESPVFGTPNKRKVIEKFSNEFENYSVGSDEMVMFLQEAVAVLGMACYINGSMPSMLLLAHNFAGDFKEGVLANANCGGENAHRGAALGALLGANSVTHGTAIPADWKQQLVHKPDF